MFFLLIKAFDFILNLFLAVFKKRASLIIIVFVDYNNQSHIMDLTIHKGKGSMVYKQGVNIVDGGHRTVFTYFTSPTIITK